MLNLITPPFIKIYMKQSDTTVKVLQENILEKPLANYLFPLVASPHKENSCQLHSLAQIGDYTMVLKGSM